MNRDELFEAARKAYADQVDELVAIQKAEQEKRVHERLVRLGECAQQVLGMPFDPYVTYHPSGEYAYSWGLRFSTSDNASDDPFLYVSEACTCAGRCGDRPQLGQACRTWTFAKTIQNLADLGRILSADDSPVCIACSAFCRDQHGGETA